MVIDWIILSIYEMALFVRLQEGSHSANLPNSPRTPIPHTGPPMKTCMRPSTLIVRTCARLYTCMWPTTLIHPHLHASIHVYMYPCTFTWTYPCLHTSDGAIAQTSKSQNVKCHRPMVLKVKKKPSQIDQWSARKWRFLAYLYMRKNPKTSHFTLEILWSNAQIRKKIQQMLRMSSSLLWTSTSDYD